MTTTEHACRLVAQPDGNVQCSVPGCKTWLHAETCRQVLSAVPTNVIEAELASRQKKRGT